MAIGYEKEEYDLKQMQQGELTLLDEFARVCRKRSIPFFLAYGTCLGAIRHKGFIPWDDDIDVFVFAKDLDRLRVAMLEELDDRFFYQCEQTEPDFNMTITRLRLNGTTALNVENADRDIHQGLFIDIYPLNEMAPGKAARYRQKLWAMVNCLLTVNRLPMNHGAFWKAAAAIGLAVLDRKWIKKKARRVMARYENTGSDTLCSLCSGWSTIDRELPADLFVMEDVEFEGRKMPVPRGYDTFLTMRYGDYMRLPPEDQRKGEHTIYFFDPYNSYEKYRGTKYLIGS